MPQDDTLAGPPRSLSAAISLALAYIGKHWEEEVAIITGAPILFAITTALVVFATWFIFRFFHKRELATIPNLKTELSIRDAENARLKGRLTEKDGEIAKLESKVKELLVEKGTPSVATPLPVPPKAQRLHFEFSEALIDRSNPNVFVVVVSVHNQSASTISGVSVRIESMQKIEEPEQSEITHLLKAFHNLPLPPRDDHTIPPRHEIDIHPNVREVFNLVTLQRQNQQHRGEILLHHTRGQMEKDGSWLQRPPGALPLGRYRVRVKAQGRDVPAEPLSIEFENVPGRAQAWQA